MIKEDKGWVLYPALVFTKTFTNPFLFLFYFFCHDKTKNLCFACLSTIFTGR